MTQPHPAPTSAGSPATTATRYPAARRDDIVDDLHGQQVPDPYRWLEDAESPQTRAWTAAQQQLLAEDSAAWPARGRFAARLGELLAAGSVSAPVWRGQRRFLTRRTGEQEHAVLLTVDADGGERVLLDPVAVDPTGATTLDAWQPSVEGDLLGYQLSAGGTEESVVRVLDVDTGADVDGPIDRVRYSPLAWLPGGKACYYVRRLAPELLAADERQYHRRVYLHRVGDDPADDVEVFGAGLDPTNYYDVWVSRNGRWLVVAAAQGTAPRTDVWMADLVTGRPDAPALRQVQVGVDARAGLYVGRDGRLYVHTDRDAPRGRLCVADPERPQPQHWQDLLSEDPEAVLEDYALLDGDELERPVLLASWTRHAVSEVSVHDLATGERLDTLELPGLGTVGGLHARPEGGHEAWFDYTDHVTPVRVLHYDARAGGGLSVWETAPGSVSVPAVEAHQVTYSSTDGTDVRMFVLAPPGKPDRPRPTILYGYGGFAIPMTPGYSATVLSWVEAGGVYAIACLRGGSEEGEGWHRVGMREHKGNVFADFHAAAERLVADGWTTPELLGISGGSNGGLLVGAALTQRPELYRAVVCAAPLLDMVRYERHGLGATWNDEYGTAADPTELSWLLSYSPYHHVHPGTAYPAVLFTVFAGDSRVDPLHARKMCAALQHATVSDPAERPVLYREETEVGHGARAVSRTVALSADVLAFFAAQLELERT